MNNVAFVVVKYFWSAHVGTPMDAVAGREQGHRAARLDSSPEEEGVPAGKCQAGKG